jgi:predicted aldo/keto reductase-like oxidoreductase
MGPVGGGRLGNSSKVLEGLVPGINRVPQLALRFVLDNPNVTVALSGMGSMEMLMENVPTASLETPLSPADSLAIQDHLSRMKSFAQLYCTGCNYCLPCPRQVAIPKIFERYNVGRVYGLWDVAKNQYAGIGANEKDLDRKADSCNECGACEKKCPQNIPIRKQLKEAHAALANS